jgi:hypothetical protein
MFQISALPHDTFESLYSADDETLARHGAARYVVDSKPGFPCRVSLEDAEPGERVILVPYQHQPADSPYKATGPIFVRENARRAEIAPDAVPELLRLRLLSVRAYDFNDLLIDADVVEGRELEACVGRFFERQAVAYAHVHFARPGCYACRVDRA